MVGWVVEVPAGAPTLGLRVGESLNVGVLVGAFVGSALGRFVVGVVAPNVGRCVGVAEGGTLTEATSNAAASIFWKLGTPNPVTGSQPVVA